LRQRSPSLDGPDAPIPVTAPGTAVAVTIVGEALVAGDTGGRMVGAIAGAISRSVGVASGAAGSRGDPSMGG